ncbi:hypothetical protein Taro_034765 [Colocasia esculenta]|uniref:Uncharacterized protein n=1 Tax=Colocasia esculenta TaxID=4460 RepID=A0A843VX86_COLES|nr:hypothetical protein [Colocasia esculenta]
MWAACRAAGGEVLRASRGDWALERGFGHLLIARTVRGAGETPEDFCSSCSSRRCGVLIRRVFPRLGFLPVKATEPPVATRMRQADLSR